MHNFTYIIIIATYELLPKNMDKNRNSGVHDALTWHESAWNSVHHLVDIHVATYHCMGITEGSKKRAVIWEKVWAFKCWGLFFEQPYSSEKCLSDFKAHIRTYVYDSSKNHSIKKLQLLYFLFSKDNNKSVALHFIENKICTLRSSFHSECTWETWLVASAHAARRAP